MTRTAATAFLAASVAACGAAAGSLPPQALGVSARTAHLEARSIARSWSPDARLRWVEGEGIDAAGLALPERGVWSFHYGGPDDELELRVRVGSLETTTEERAATSPPGYVLGDNVLGTDWIDSPAALAAAADGGAGPVEGPLTLRLVPTVPPEWQIRSDAGGRWRIHAETGEVLTP